MTNKKILKNIENTNHIGPIGVKEHRDSLKGIKRFLIGFTIINIGMHAVSVFIRKQV